MFTVWDVSILRVLYVDILLIDIIDIINFNLRWINFGYVLLGTITYHYLTGLIFGEEKLTVHTGPVRYRTRFGTCSHG